VSTRSWIERVQDILDAINEILYFTRGLDLKAFQHDTKTIKAVELNFVIIGEAAAHISNDVQAVYPQIPWRLMRNMRNCLVHVYFAIDPLIVWNTIQNDLSPLIPLLEALLQEHEPGNNDEAG
jgi:uncharacterized protein with HEPN domain